MQKSLLLPTLPSPPHHPTSGQVDFQRKTGRLIAELLTEIKFPSHRLSNDIADRVFEEFGIEISLNAITNANDRQVLYINQK